MIGEPRESQSPLRTAFLAIEQFQFTQLQQERQVIDVLLGTTRGQFFTLVVHRRQSEHFQMMLEQHQAFGFDRLHRAPPGSKVA